MQGAELAAVQRIMRHQDPRITSEVYGHLAPGYLKKDFSTRFLPEPGPAAAHGGELAGGVRGVGPGEQKTARARSTAATPADLRGLWGGRDRLLKVAEVAEHLGVSKATVYGLCEGGELPYVWVVTSLRIRPDDLKAFVGSKLTVPEKRRPHRRKPS